MIRSVITVAFAVALVACNSHDSDYFPYAMTGLNVFVYDDASGKEYAGGFVKASYVERQEAVTRCAARADAMARQHLLQRWGYVCCTATLSSGCVTKVR